MPPQESLTAHLPTLTPHSLHRATTHPFLQRAGQGTLPKPVLEQWLSQDRLYAQSYIRFIGLLLSKIRFPAKPQSHSQVRTQSQTQSESASLESRISSTLIDALVNIRREIEFFEATAAAYGLDLSASTPTTDTEGEEEFGPNAITHAYIDLFMAAGSPGASLLEGMVVLWATETCYLRAWRFAGTFLTPGQQGQGEEQDTDGGALRKEFIPNWSSREFEGFVDEIGELVDQMARGLLVADGEKGEVMRRCERWWRQVVWLEERFWPDVNS